MSRRLRIMIVFLGSRKMTPRPGYREIVVECFRRREDAPRPYASPSHCHCGIAWTESVQAGTEQPCDGPRIRICGVLATLVLAFAI